MLDVEKGHSGVFQCEVLGTGPFGFNWFDTKAPVDLDKMHSLRFQDSIAHLAMHSFEKSDIGKRHYYLSNEVGQISSESVAELRG